MHKSISCIMAALVQSAVGIAILSVNTSAFAQEQQRYVFVGKDPNGISFFFDTEDLGVDNAFKIYQIKQGNITQMIFQPSCSDHKLTYSAINVFNMNRQQLSAKQINRQMPLKRDTAAYRAMSFVCKVRGFQNY